MPTMPATSLPDQHDTGEVVLGVDTHKDAHVATVLNSLGAVLGTACFATTAAGYRALLAWAQTFGLVARAGVECTGTYGKGLARHLSVGDVEVVEVNAPDRATRRRRGKTDTIDAEAAARAVLSGRADAVAKSGDGTVEMLRMFKLAKASAIKSRTQAINQLKNVLVAADATLRDSLAGLTTKALIRHCAELTVQTCDDVAGATLYTLRLLAQRIQQLSTEITDLNSKLTTAIAAHAPTLLQQTGIGADCGAELLIAAGDNPERLRSEASFAALCGTSPVEASSGKTHRRRLNRGGNRHANSALHLIVVTRLRWCPRTRAYLQRRTAEGLSKRDIMRCLKRYIAREIYQIITEAQHPAAPVPAAA